MANVLNGNTFYIDTQFSVSSDELAIKGVRVPYIFYSTSSATNSLILVDSVTGIKKITFQNINNAGQNGDSRVFDFREYPVLFPNGIKPLSLANCIVTCVIIDPRG